MLRSACGAARRLRRKAGPEHQGEDGRDDENVPGEVVHAANLVRAHPTPAVVFTTVRLRSQSCDLWPSGVVESPLEPLQDQVEPELELRLVRVGILQVLLRVLDHVRDRPGSGG